MAKVKVLQNGELRMAEPDLDQWVVILFPKNKLKCFYSVRLFKNFDIAAAHYGKKIRSTYAYVSAGEMSHRLTTAKLQEYIKDLASQFANEKEQYRSSALYKDRRSSIEEDSFDQLIEQGGRDALAKGLWYVCHLVGDQVRGLPDSPENEDKFKIDLDKLCSEAGRATWEKFPKQARVICQALIDHGEQVVEEGELHRLVVELVKQEKLKTKQDPVLIWRYYAPWLGDQGFLYYPGKRHKLENHAEEMSKI